MMALPLRLSAALLNIFDNVASFEGFVMTTVSIGLAILLTPFYQNVPREALPHRPAAVWVVILLCSSVLLLQLVSIIARIETGFFVSETSLTASVFSFFGTLGVMYVFNSSYAFSFPPVAFPSILLATTVPYELAIAQHCLKSQAKTILAVQIAVIAVKSLAVGVGYNSRSRLFPHRPAASSHQYFLPWSSFTSISGLRSNFTMEDLPEIIWNEEPEVLYQRFCLHFEEADKESNLAIIKPYFLTLKPHLVASIPFHLCHIAFSLALPFLLRRVVYGTFSNAYCTMSMVFDILGTLLVFSGVAIFKFLSQAADARTNTAARTIYASAVYDKTLRLNIENIDKSFLGPSLSKNMSEIEELLQSARGCVWATIHVCLGLVFLFPLAGTASFLIFVPILFVGLASMRSASSEAQQRKAYNEKRLSRTKVVASVLVQILNIKVMGLEPVIGKYLHCEKAAEIAALLHERYSRMTMFAIAAFNHGLTPGFVFGGLLYLDSSAEMLLGPNVFACFVMISIIADSASQALDHIANGTAGIQSISRLQKYLLKPDLPRLLQDEDGQLPPGCPRVQPVCPFRIDVRSISVASAQGHDIIQNLTMQVLRGCVAIVYTAEPYGKSTLAGAILGELPFHEGSITLSENHVSFCGQDSWIQNDTIEANIVGSYTLHRSWYNRVVGACLLAADLNRLLERGQTMAGTDGCNFDASLKQRIALARAIFGRAPLIILDGILAAVSPEMAVRILHNLFGPRGLVRNWDCTVLLTTSNYEYLRCADVIFEMGPDYKFHRYDDVARYLRSGNPSLRRQHEQPTYRNTDLHRTMESRSLQLQSSVFTENDDHSHDRQRLKLLQYFLSPAGSFLIVLFPLAAAIAATMKKMPEIFLHMSLNNRHFDETCFGRYVLLAIGSIICNQISARIFFAYINTKCSETLHGRLTDTILCANHNFLRCADMASPLKIFAEDIPTISRDLPLAFMQICFMIVTAFLNLTILTMAAKYAWLLIIAYLVTFYHAQTVFIPYYQQLLFLERQSVAAVAAIAAETVDGIQYIRATRREESFLESLFPVLVEFQKSFYHRFRASSRLVLIFDLFTTLSATLLVILAHTFPQSTSSATLGLAFSMLIRFSGETTFLVHTLSRLDDSLDAVSRIRQFCERTPTEPAATTDSPVHSSWPAFGRIDFENITTNRSDIEGDLLTAHNLEDVNLSVPPMEKAGICAKVGHGQSALFLSLLGLEDYSGTIRIDTLNIRSVPSQVLRSRITTIPQDGLELHGSVRLNLDPLSIVEPHFSDMDLLNVLERVGLWGIVSRQGGLDANISLMRFTPVQRQLLGLARAVLHRRRLGTNIVLIDKATSNLEGDQERRMQDFMDGEFATCTVITIADRMTTVETADHLCILEAGALKRVLQTHFIDVTEEIVG